MEDNGTILDTVTFLAAWLGYLSVTVTMLARFGGSERMARLAAPTMLVVATLHVFLVWSVRYEFDPSNAATAGTVPTILLYSIYVLIVTHTFGRRRNAFAGRAVYPAWILVTLIGTPSTFVVSHLTWLQIPMVLTFVSGIVGLFVIHRQRRTQS